MSEVSTIQAMPRLFFLMIENVWLSQYQASIQSEAGGEGDRGGGGTGVTEAIL